MDPPAPSSSPEWRAARHRMRGDLQTLASLLRLGAYRASAEELIAAFPDWLNAMATVYDLIPSPQGEAPISLRALVAALNTHNVAVAGGEDVLVPASAALAVALGVEGLLSFCRNAAGTPGDTRIEITGDSGLSVTAVCAASGTPADWPPLGLGLAAEALGGEIERSHKAGMMSVSLVFPCP